MITHCADRRATGFVLLLLLAGCAAQDKTSSVTPVATTASPDQQHATSAPPVASKPDPIREWAKLFERARQQLADDELATAQSSVKELEARANDLSLELPQLEELAQLADELTAKTKFRVDQQRETQLAQAQQRMDVGQLDESLRALGDVLAHSPTDVQRERATAITAEIERRRLARRQLKGWMQMLASADRKEVQAAQTQLLQDPETALGLLLEAVQAGDKRQLAEHALETLRLVNRPDVTLPALVEVLGNVEHKSLWPIAARELQLSPLPGAGAALLELAIRVASEDQRQLALETLAVVPDPPPHTIVALLPAALQDNSTLALVLRVCRHSVLVHGQTDLVAQRGMDFEMTIEQAHQLRDLPARLASIVATGQPVEAVIPAKSLAAACGLLASAPFTGVQVLRAEAELPESPATAVVDGVWNSMDLKSMWRHPPDKRGTIVFDLGQSRIVTGVRLWNLNEPGAPPRGWKEVMIYVGDTPSESAAAATGLVPTAPGAAGAIDYSTRVAVPFVSGRYVRLQATSLWPADAPSGLTEVQIIGL